MERPRDRESVDGLGREHALCIGAQPEGVTGQKDHRRDRRRGNDGRGAPEEQGQERDGRATAARPGVNAEDVGAERQPTEEPDPRGGEAEVGVARDTLAQGEVLRRDGDRELIEARAGNTERERTAEQDDVARESARGLHRP